MEGPLTGERLRQFDLDGPVSEPFSLDLHRASSELTEAAKDSDQRGELDQAYAYRLVNTICQLHFRPDERAEPYGPIATFANGGRTATGSDFTQDQCESLFANSDRLKSVLLRGRIADLTWLNRRSNVSAAHAAVKAFVELTQWFLGGGASSEFRDLAPGDPLIVGLLNRAITISRALGWDGDQESDLRTALIGVYENTVGTPGPGFSRAAELILRSGALEPTRVFEDAMEIGRLAKDRGHLDEAEWALGRAVNAALEIKSHEMERAAKLELSELYEAKADGAGAGFLKVHALEQAIQALRGLRERERRRSLHLKLSDAQIDVQDELGTVEHSIELGELVERTKKTFEPLDLYSALREFTLAAVPKKREKMLEEARQLAEQFPLSGLFPIAIIDERGRTTAREGASEVGEATRHSLLRNMSVDITVTVGGIIEPAREVIYSKLNLSEAHLIALCRLSPFVPEHAVTMFGEGLFAFFQREYSKAATHCLPYLEACLRHVLDQAGEPTTVIKDTGIESNITLSTVLGRFREQIERVLPSEYVFAIENLFGHPLGEKYRHRFAHGLLSRGHYFSHTMIYALWLMFSLTVIPLLSHWDEVCRILTSELD